MTNKRKLNRYAAQVVASLISAGYYDFKMNRTDEYLEIDILYIIPSPYTYLRVYDDGIIHYYDGSGIQFEGSAIRKQSIIKDILRK